MAEIGELSIQKESFESLQKERFGVNWFERVSEIPKKNDFDFTYLSGIDKESMEEAVEILARYIRTPAITDNFQDHIRERIQAIAALDPEKRKVLSENRLRIVKISAVIESMRLVTDILGTESVVGSWIKEKRAALWEKYGAKTDAVNISVEEADQVSEYALGALKLLSKKP